MLSIVERNLSHKIDAISITRGKNHLVLEMHFRELNEARAFYAFDHGRVDLLYGDHLSITKAGQPTREEASPDESTFYKGEAVGIKAGCGPTGVRLTFGKPDARVHERRRALAHELIEDEFASQTESSKRVRPKYVTRKAHREIINRAVKYLVDHSHEKITLTALSRAAHSSPHHLTRMITLYFDMPPFSLLKTIRTYKVFSSLLLDSETSLQAALREGFSDQSHLIRGFKDHFGLSPKRVLKTMYVEYDNSSTKILAAYPQREFTTYGSSESLGL